MAGPKRSLGQPAYGEWADLRDSLEVAVDVNDAESVVQGRASDEEIRDGRSVPHAVMVSQIPLEIVSAFEQVGRCGDDLEGIAKIGFESVIVLGGACRVKLLKLTDRAEKEGSRQFGELRSHSRRRCARRRSCRGANPLPPHLLRCKHGDIHAQA